jgi:SpoVK/Ycf46/Vps4 family AAA+-type ATPase
MASKDELNNIDDKYAVVHWADAHKMDIHDGEPALIARTQEGSSFVATVCNVRISGSAPPANISYPKTTSPLLSKKKTSESSKCGEIILMPKSLYDYFSARRLNPGDDIIRTNPHAAKEPSLRSLTEPTPPAETNPYTSPSKSTFSFSKGGGGESLITTSSSSGSKFSFSNRGGGDTLLTPCQTKTSSSQHNKHKPFKVLVAPLINLSQQQIRRLLPDAQKLYIFPMKSSGETSTIDSYISSSNKIIQALIVSKYQGQFFPMPRENIRSDEQYETISISFRGKTEYFRLTGVTPVPPGGDESGLSLNLNRLCISESKIEMSEHEEQLQAFIQSQFRGLDKKNQHFGIAFRITPQTIVDFASSLTKENPMTFGTRQKTSPTDKTQIKLGAGLETTLSRIKDVLLPPLLRPDLFPFDGPLRPPKGALLYGPAGVGKSLVAAQIANDLSFTSDQLRVRVQFVQCADILSSTAIVGEAEKMLTGVFEVAESEAMGCMGTLVILDDVHLICPRRGGMSGFVGGSGVDQLAGTLLALLDGIGKSRDRRGKSGGGLSVLAVTSDPSLLDPALRRPGRLDVEVEVAVPDDVARADIVRFHLSSFMTEQQLKETDINVLARLAKGFTGADCKLAVKEAVRTAMSRTPRPNCSGEQTFFAAGSCDIKYDDLVHAIRITKPSAIKSVVVEVPKVPWSAIGGMDDVKALLKESIELPLTHPHLFEMMRVPPPKGILLYGPPGCSKTLMARAIATEGNMNFLAVKGPELLSKWLGESERALASLFRRARLAAPAVIFFDELDSIASKRGDGGGCGGDRLLSQLLTELDGVTSGGSGSSGGKGGRVVVVGATNRPDVLDIALTRPGRMDRMIYVGLPDEQGRHGIFKIGLSGKDCHQDVDVSSFRKDHRMWSFFFFFFNS